METRIPFEGFYETKWSQGIDDAEEQCVESLAGEHDIEQDEIAALLWRKCNYRQAYLYIAQEYVPPFQDALNRALGLDIALIYKDMTSPREYNFETDKIWAEISYRDALRLARRVGRKALRKEAKDMFTSRDGFCSFYDPDISTWGQLRTWDHNQLYCLLSAAVDATQDEDLSWGIYEDFSSNGYFDIAFSQALDRSDFMLELGKLIGRKELTEELEDNELGDTKRFPVAWSGTQDYVAKYNTMNSNNLAQGDI